MACVLCCHLQSFIHEWQHFMLLFKLHKPHDLKQNTDKCQYVKCLSMFYVTNI